MQRQARFCGKAHGGLDSLAAAASQKFDNDGAGEDPDCTEERGEKPSEPSKGQKGKVMNFQNAFSRPLLGLIVTGITTTRLRVPSRLLPSKQLLTDVYCGPDSGQESVHNHQAERALDGRRA